MKILLVEDDDVFIKILTKTLKTQHYIIDTVKDGEMGWTYGSTFEYDLIILDIVLPKLDGISLCKRFRAEGYITPILLLSAQNSSTAKVQGLDAGADDYVVKPFDPAELIARIRALRRRSSTNPFPLLTWGDLILNPSTCEVSYRGQHLALTTKEYELLELMLRNSQHVFSTEELLDHLWSSEKFPSEATVRSHIRRVRHKLVTIGAPQDFIATMHGRGYYLKPANASESTSALKPALGRSPNSTFALEPDIDFSTGGMASTPEAHRADDAQHQYLAFLNETWITTKPNCIDQIATLLEAIQALQSGQFDAQQQAQAQQLAHKLAGTLNIFGLHKAVHLARQLEHWLGSQDDLQPNQAPLMNRLVMALQQTIHETAQIQQAQIPTGHSPLLLLVSADLSFNQSFQAIAQSRGIRLEVVLPMELDTNLTALDLTMDGVGLPDAIVLRLPASSPDSTKPEHSALTQARLQPLKTCTHRYPTVPIVVLGDYPTRGMASHHTELRDRLEVVRQGGKLLLNISTPPEQIIATTINLFRASKLPTKVMIVDGDRHWLHTLPTLLKPWGFKVTTLDDPHQFWTVLQAVIPDVVVIDSNMPEISGFELCQILRSDPHWQRLPVLFLSSVADPLSQQQAFTVGADDYLCKPLTGGDLASRILNRLQRIQVWSN